jgi:hypothetical protein
LNARYFARAIESYRFFFRPVSTIGRARTNMNSLNIARSKTAPRKDPVTSFICPTTVGIMNEPRFPTEVINPTALAMIL